MMSLPRLRDSRDFSPYSSSAEWTDEDKTSLSALSEVDVEGAAVAGLARFTGLKKEDIEEGPAVAGIWITFLQGFQSFFDTTETFSKSFDVQATHRFFLVSLSFCLL
ncbi:hypothetical protein E2C01_048497 [Portunus trituberculatus]|uniref:Uncharacterized protein n=1 Tax=Portunus trituberculatus TaxID=210409 RepID=A0A5B7GAQ5_PORTR|nr:hypothetical protein [Portunus trituberculatus]